MSPSSRLKSWAKNNCRFPGSLVPANTARAQCPATCSVQAFLVEIPRGEGQGAPMLCKDRRHFSSCSQTENFSQVTACSVCWIQVFTCGTNTYAGHTVPTTVTCWRADLFLWWRLLWRWLPELLGCFSGKALLRCYSLIFETYLSHVVVIETAALRWHWDAFLPVARRSQAWRSGFSKSGVGRIGEINTNPE